MKKARFKIDENLPVEFAEILRDNQFDAQTVYGEGLNGKSDQSVARACTKENRAIITSDLDFADITTYPPEKFNGIIVFRVGNQNRTHLIYTLKTSYLHLRKSRWRNASGSSTKAESD